MAGHALIPTRLKAGDTIGIVSPSTPVTDELSEQFRRGVEFLGGLGFRLVIGEHVRSKTLGYAASPQEKAEDINRMFADEAIKAIICSQGGATANACLPYLSWDAIRDNPKIFVGISDITVLLNAIHHKTGLVTFHGDDVMWGFGRHPTAYDRQEFIACLMDARIGEVAANRERRTIRGGAAEGKLLGGNLLCLLKLAGTPYWPDFAGAIFFVEALNITPEACDYQFRQLEQMGVFDAIQGAIVGYVDGLQKDENATHQMEDVLLDATSRYGFPILKVNDFGHNCPNTVLPVGGRVKVDADRQTVEILTNCVQ
jgi:muramoyltetrapeptide carboxypeptidase